MNYHVYSNELRTLKSNFVAGVIKLVVFLSLFLLAHFFLQANRDSIKEALEYLSYYTKALLGIDQDTFLTPLGLYSFLFIYLTILAAFFSSSLGFKIITAEYSQNTIMFLLTKPIKRREILKSKNFAALTYLLFYHIIFQIMTLILFVFIDGFDNLFTVLTLNFALLLIQITLFYISLIIASFVKKPKMVLLMSVFMIITFFILSFIENLFNLTFLRFINPFSFFSAKEVVNYGIQFDLIMNTLFIVVFAINFAYGCYENDDIL